jgi:hypothetical protein
MSGKKKRPRRRPLPPPPPARASQFRRFGEANRRLVVRYGSLAIIIVMLTVGIGTLGSAWAAHTGHGTPGTWTATGRHCGKSCYLFGDFTPAGDAAPALANTTIGGGATAHAVGDSEAAVDVSGHIYPAGGGDDWLKSITTIVVAALALALWIWFAVRRHQRRPALTLAGRRPPPTN